MTPLEFLPIDLGLLEVIKKGDTLTMDCYPAEIFKAGMTCTVKAMEPYMVTELPIIGDIHRIGKLQEVWSGNNWVPICYLEKAPQFSNNPWPWPVSCAPNADQQGFNPLPIGVTQKQLDQFNEAMNKALIVGAGSYTIGVSGGSGGIGASGGFPGGGGAGPGLGEPRGAFGGAPGGCTITNAKDLEANKKPDCIAPELMSKKLRDW